MTPSVSVAMTTYNGGRFVGRQLESIIGQTCLPDEIVVGDDHSTDATWGILSQFAATCPVPVRLRQNDVTTGLRVNIERALRSCAGDVIVLCDQDDWWHEDKIKTVRAAFDDPGVALWFSDADLVDEVGVALGTTTWESVHLDTEARDLLSTGRGLERLLHGQTVTGAAMAFRRSVLDVALPLPPELEGPDHLYLHDGWLAVLAYCQGTTVAERRRLTAYRQHSSQTTAMSMTSVAATAGGRSADQLQLDAARTHLVAQRLAASSTPSPRLAELRRRDDFLRRRMDLRAGRVRSAVKWQSLTDYRDLSRGARSFTRDALAAVRSRSSRHHPSGL